MLSMFSISWYHFYLSENMPIGWTVSIFYVSKAAVNFLERERALFCIEEVMTYAWRYG